jgi:hypothetical protein
MNGWIRNFRFRSGRIVGALVWMAVAATASSPLAAQEAEWIWSPEHEKENVPEKAVCHFRKAFTLRAPEAGAISIAADDQYDLFVNGRKIASGESTKKLDEHDLSEFLSRGVNIIAIKVTNQSGNTAALAARGTVKERGGNWRS